MMASGEIRLSGTTTRQMPVLAQSQDPSAQSTGTAQSQSVVDPCAAGGCLDQVTVTSSRSNSGPLLAQVFIGFDGVDPVMEALQQGRIPTAADYAARASQFKPQVGVPPPLPQVAPPPPWWLQVLQWLGSAIDRIGGVSPAAPPVAPTLPPPAVCPPDAPCIA